MAVIVIGLGTPRSAGENFGGSWEHLEAPATSPGAPGTSLGVPATNLGAPATHQASTATSLGAPRITDEQYGINFFFGNVAGAPGKPSYYFSFNDY